MRLVEKRTLRGKEGKVEVFAPSKGCEGRNIGEVKRMEKSEL